MTRILALHAHPDDIETLAAATLALLAGQGHRITIATVTAGDCGATETDNETTARNRKSEAAAAAKVIGADYLCVGIPDLGVFNDDATRRKVTETIRAAQPDLVITASPVDYHPDHEATSALVRDACFAAPVKNYRTGDAKLLAEIPHLYFCDPIEGRDRDYNKVMAEFAVNVDGFFETTLPYELELSILSFLPTGDQGRVRLVSRHARPSLMATSGHTSPAHSEETTWHEYSTPPSVFLFALSNLSLRDGIHPISKPCPTSPTSLPSM